MIECIDNQPIFFTFLTPCTVTSLSRSTHTFAMLGHGNWSVFRGLRRFSFVRPTNLGHRSYILKGGEQKISIHWWTCLLASEGNVATFPNILMQRCDGYGGVESFGRAVRGMKIDDGWWFETTWWFSIVEFVVGWSSTRVPLVQALCIQYEYCTIL